MSADQKPDASFVVALSFCGFASAMSGRVVDPMVTAVAADLAVPVTTVALLSTAFALPLAFSQPLLRPLGDLFRKARLVQASVVALAVMLFISAASPNFTFLFVSRIAAGAVSGSILPIGFALIGDAVPIARRQLAISRLLAAALVGQLLGASLAGLLSEFVNWRVVFGFVGLVTTAAAVTAALKLPAGRVPSGGPKGVAAVLANYALVFRNPRAFVCFSIVLVEGAAIYGWLPFIAPFLVEHGLGGGKEAGAIIGCLGVGGLAYSLAVPFLLRVTGRPVLMAAGGVLAAIGLGMLGMPMQWSAAAGFMTLLGFGFFMLHNSVQTEVSELAPDARSSAFSLHAFSFYVGQAAGPALYAASLPWAGAEISLVLAAAGLLAVAALAFGVLGQTARVETA